MAGIALFFASDAFLDQALLQLEEHGDAVAVPVSTAATAAAAAAGGGSGGGRTLQRSLALSDKDGTALELPQLQQRQQRKSRIALVVRCLAGLIGGVIHNTGVWTILDQYIPASGAWANCSLQDGESGNWISCSARNFGYVGIGLAMLGTWRRQRPLSVSVLSVSLSFSLSLCVCVCARCSLLSTLLLILHPHNLPVLAAAMCVSIN